MKNLTYTLAILVVACSAPSKKQDKQAQTYATTGSVERLDPRMDSLISQDAAIEVLASGFSWSEGPVWVPALNAVLFTDVPENIVYKWTEADSISEYLNPSGYTGEKQGKEGANGLILDLDETLILCQHGDRRLARMLAPLDSPAEKYETIADRYLGARFNSPNDVVQNSRGTFFFTDPPYGLQEDDSTELDFQGVYKVDTTGNALLLVDSLTRPNGVNLSPDENTLYVAVSDRERAKYYAYDLDENDNITGGRILLDVTAMIGEERKGLPDGLDVDNDGNLFATGPGGVLVISPEGDHLGTIMTGVPTANCTFNEDKSVLYITAHKHLMRIKLNP